jgi:hypothetical protein
MRPHLVRRLNRANCLIQLLLGRCYGLGLLPLAQCGNLLNERRDLAFERRDPAFQLPNLVIGGENLSICDPESVLHDLEVVLKDSEL